MADTPKLPPFGPAPPAACRVFPHPAPSRNRGQPRTPSWGGLWPRAGLGCGPGRGLAGPVRGLGPRAAWRGGGCGPLGFPVAPGGPGCCGGGLGFPPPRPFPNPGPAPDPAAGWAVARRAGPGYGVGVVGPYSVLQLPALGSGKPGAKPLRARARPGAPGVGVRGEPRFRGGAGWGEFPSGIPRGPVGRGRLGARAERGAPWGRLRPGLRERPGRVRRERLGRGSGALRPGTAGPGCGGSVTSPRLP